MFNNLKKRINESADQIKQAVESPTRLASSETKQTTASPATPRKNQTQLISNEDLNKLRNEFKKLKQENERLKVKAQAGDDLNRQFDEEIQNLKNEIHIRDERVSERDQTLESSEHELEIANKKLKNMSKKLQIAENVIDSLKNTPELTALPSNDTSVDPEKIQNLQSEIVELRDELKTARSSFDQKNLEFNGQEEKIADLETSQKSLQTQLEDKTRELNFLGVQLNQLESEKKAEAKKYESQKRKIEMLTLQLSQLSDIESKQNMKEKESKQLENMYQAKVRECEEYTLAVKRLKEGAENTKKNSEKTIQDLKNELDQLKFTVESNEKKWREGESNTEKLMEEVGVLREQNKNIVVTQKQKDTSLQTTKLLLSDLEKKYNNDLSEFEELKMKHDQLNSKFTTALAQANSALQSSKGHENDLKKVVEQSKVHQKTIESLRKELAKELKKNFDLSKEITDLQKSVKQVASPAQENVTSPRGSFSKSPASRNASRDSYTGTYKNRRPSGALYKSVSSMDDSVILGYDTDTREANWQYLKHIVLKFILASSSQRSSLANVLCTVLHLNDREEQLLYETLAYKSSYLKTKKPSMFI